MAFRKENQTPHAPFSLIHSGPMLASDVLAKLGGKFFRSAFTPDPDPKATRDAALCPECQSEVEWAVTKKTTGERQGTYVYARCIANGAAHRWSFRKAPSEPPTPRQTPPPPSPPSPRETTMSTPATLQNLADALQGLIGTQIEERLASVEATVAKVDPETIKQIVAAQIDVVAGKLTREVKIEIPSIPTAKFEGKAHPALERVLKLIAAGQRFFLLVGPAATGKSTLAKQVAETLKRPFCATAITETMQREDLLGVRAHDLMKGEVKYRSTPIVDTWEAGGVICLDELDRGNPNTLCALNSIEQGALYVPRSDAEGGSVSKSATAIVIGTANTYGTGASRTYVGANQLDAAFVDRFRVIEVGYDREIETVVCGGDETARQMVALIQTAREKADRASVRRPLTTRIARRATIDRRLDPKLDAAEAYKALCKGSGWTETELNAVWG